MDDYFTKICAVMEKENFKFVDYGYSFLFVFYFGTISFFLYFVHLYVSTFIY